MHHPDTPPQMLGQKIVSPHDPSSQYRLETLLGKQTGRRTFLALDLRSQAKVVIKLLLFGPDFTWADLKLFQREGQTLKSLKHPAIPQYLDSFEVTTALGDGFVLVQSYILACGNLQSQVEQGRRFGEDELRAIAQSILKILEYLHSLSPPVIHRDIKPSNILISQTCDGSADDVHLVDFGSVQATASHGGTMTIVGTYGYMPPEQFGGRAIAASDLYSLGMTLIYIITSEHPADLLNASGQLDFEQQVTQAQNIPSEFVHWLRQLTYTDLSKRTETAIAALRQLDGTDTADSSYLSPTYNDFQVLSTPDALELQFLPFRLEDASNAEPASWMLWTATCAIALFATLMYGSSGLFLIVAIMFPVVGVRLLPGQNPPFGKAFRRAQALSLRLQSTTQDVVCLSLEALSTATSDVTRPQMTPQKRTTQLSQSRVESVTIKALPKAKRGNYYHCIAFQVDIVGLSGSQKLSIFCQPSEAQWLHNHLTRWDRNLISPTVLRTANSI